MSLVTERKYLFNTSGALLPFIPDANTVLWLPGQDDAYSATIRDRSGNGNDGTIYGAAWAKNPQGLWVLDFDGADDYVDCGTSVSLTTTMTFEAWIYVDSSHLGEIISNWEYSAGDYRSFLLRVTAADKIQFGISRDGGSVNASYITSDATFSTTTWFHVAATWSIADNTMRIYQNGVVDINTDTETACYDSAYKTYIGVMNALIEEDFTGDIALARIYDRALSATELLGHYNQERHLFGV